MKSLSLVFLTFFLVSCQTLPSIHSSGLQADTKGITCPDPFLKEKYRMVHAIETRLAGKTQTAVIGVTSADPSTRTLACAILTAEGMVLFEAESTRDHVKVHRALPPFDSEELSRNMIQDIELIFFAPEEQIHTRGNLPDGSTVCRYRLGNRDWIDVIGDQSGTIEIKRYSLCGILKRHIIFNKAPENIYPSIELQAYETFNYSLRMNLIEAQPAANQ